MTKDQALAKYALMNLELQAENEDLRQSIYNIHGILFSIGGPLNDNFKQYSKEQLVTFSRIYHEIQGVE